MLKYAERQINDDGASVNGVSSSRNHYTKMETKIQCIDSIERGQATVEQVASRLHLPVQVIRNWFSNK
jgi:transposase-like protein